MPLTIQVIVPASETTATLVSLGGTGTAANPYTITPIAGTKLGTIEVADAANLLGAWSWNVGTRAFGRVNIVAGVTSYPLLSAQEAAAAAIAAYGPPTRAEATQDKDEVIAAVEAIEGGGGGAGATADEIVDELLDRGITAIPVQSGVTSSGNLELVQGDTYNGIAKPLLSFPTSADYTDGWTATLTIRDKDDAVIATASGVVASSTQVTVSLTAPTGLTFTGCPGVWQGKFDVQMSKNTQRATIAKGVAYVHEDQTRS
jgi:hypothetical protein